MQPGHVITELLNIEVGTKKSGRCNRFVPKELVVSGIQCMFVYCPTHTTENYRNAEINSSKYVVTEFLRDIERYDIITLHPRFVHFGFSTVAVCLFLLYLQHYVVIIMSSFVVNKGGNNTFIPNWNLYLSFLENCIWKMELFWVWASVRTFMRI